MYEKLIWDALITFLKNPYGAAVMMGHLEAESNLSPTNLENSFERKLGLTDAQYTAGVDNGTYQGFVTDSCGYGLAQWTYAPRKKGLLEYVKGKGCSIGDCVAQLEYLCIELTTFPTVFNALRNATSFRPASDIVLEQFENPADKSEKVKVYRAGLAEKWFEKYAAAQPTPQNEIEEKPGCSPDAVIAVAIGELGYHEKASNAALDDKAANSSSGNFTKYARDFDQKYPNWYNGKKNGYAWCDMFTDWCFLTAYGYENALRLLCQPERSAGAGCTYSLGYFRAAGQFHQYDPQRGDQIFFGTSLSNSTHTGLVEKVENGFVYTIEGNSSDQVCRRRYSLSDSHILGYGRPAYDAISGQQETAAETEYVPVNLPVLKRGMTALAVFAAQVLLIRHGYSCGGPIVNGNEQPDGDYGPTTESSVMAFQKEKGLSADGMISADTWTALLGVKK